MANPAPTMRPFRFGLVAAPRGTDEQWVATARRAADLGLSLIHI